MSLFRAREVSIEELAANPEFLFRVGLMVATLETFGHVLSISDDEEKQRIGGLMLSRALWFEGVTPSSGTVRQPK